MSYKNFCEYLCLTFKNEPNRFRARLNSSNDLRDLTFYYRPIKCAKMVTINTNYNI